ncbi:MAG: 50S ribosomal protein L10 [Spirochaetales bacterium]|nr:50S ribosomal protein L10 [Spirochaetales bacterium]
MAEQVKKIQQYKIDAVKKIKDNIENSKDLFFVDYRGLTVEQITDLRRNLYGKKARFIISKNNFSRIAIKEAGLPEVDDILFGPTAVAYAEDDSSPVAKVLVEWMKNEVIKIKGGIIDKKVVTADDIKVISTLPTRQEILGMLAGTISAPVRNLLYVMKGVAQKFVGTLKAVADKKGEK